MFLLFTSYDLGHRIATVHCGVSASSIQYIHTYIHTGIHRPTLLLSQCSQSVAATGIHRPTLLLSQCSQSVAATGIQRPTLLFSPSPVGAVTAPMTDAMDDSSPLRSIAARSSQEGSFLIGERATRPGAPADSRSDAVVAGPRRTAGSAGTGAGEGAVLETEVSCGRGGLFVLEDWRNKDTRR